MAEVLGNRQLATPAQLENALITVVWTDVAIDNLQAIANYIEQFNPRAARDLANALVAAGNSLLTFSRRDRSVSDAEMRELVTVCHYILRYEINGDEVVVLRFLHTSRRPTDP